MNERWLGVGARALGQNREDQDVQVLWPSLSTASHPLWWCLGHGRQQGWEGPQLTPYWLYILTLIIYILVP